MRTAALVIAAVAVLIVLAAIFAIRGLRKYVRSLWPHS